MLVLAAGIFLATAAPAPASAQDQTTEPHRVKKKKKEKKRRWTRHHEKWRPRPHPAKRELHRRAERRRVERRKAERLPPPPLPPLVATPPVPASTSRFETIEATMPGTPPPAVHPTTHPAVHAVVHPAATAHFRRWYAAVRVGISIPRTKLFTGADAALELGFVLPTGGPSWLRNHLRLDLGFGWSMQPYQGAVEIAGRGADPSFVQNTTLLALTAGLVFFNTLGPPAWHLSAEAGVAYERLLVRADFESFASLSHAEDDTNGIVVLVGLARALGPGQVVLDIRYQEANADLGGLGKIGSDAMGSLVPSVGYAVRL